MVNELQAVVEGLGGKHTLGRALSTDDDMREAIREGFPPAVVGELMRASGLTLKELASALDLSPRSLQRGYFQAPFITRIVGEHLSGQRDHTLRL